MGFEAVKLYRALKFHYAASAPLTVQFWTDLPGEAMALRDTLTLPAASTPRTAELLLVGERKGRLHRVRVLPQGRATLYAGHVYARKLGKEASGWAWHPLPIVPTSSGWTEVPLPIPQTPDGFSPVPLPIPQTPEGFGSVPLPIRGTPDEFSPLAVPMPASAEGQWIQIPVDE